MAMTNCPECGRTISTKALTCPHCGYPLPEDADFRKPPTPIDPSWTERYDIVIGKRKLWHWLSFLFCLVLFGVFLCLCLLNKNVTHVWGDKYSYSTKVEWLTLSCLFGGYSIILLGFAIGVSARIKKHVEYMNGYTVLVNIGLLLVSLIVENKPDVVCFRRTFFKRGIASKLPDDTNYYVRYKNGTVECSYYPFKQDDSKSKDYFNDSKM